MALQQLLQPASRHQVWRRLEAGQLGAKERSRRVHSQDAHVPCGRRKSNYPGERPLGYVSENG